MNIKDACKYSGVADSPSNTVLQITRIWSLNFDMFSVRELVAAIKVDTLDILCYMHRLKY